MLLPRLRPFLGALTIVLAGSVAWGEEVHQGKVVFAADGKLTITDVDAVNELFIVAPDVKITLNGKSAILEDLMKGDSVKVTAERQRDKLVAKAIDAMTSR